MRQPDMLACAASRSKRITIVIPALAEDAKIAYPVPRRITVFMGIARPNTNTGGLENRPNKRTCAVSGDYVSLTAHRLLVS